MKFETTLTLLAGMLLATSARATGIDDPVPPDAIRSTRDLVLRTDDLVFRIVDTSGEVRDLRVRETDEEIQIALNADVLFDFDKADLKADAKGTLEKAAAMIREKAAKGAAVRIGGHTDAKGKDAYNASLSLRRADSVKNWLAKDGVKDVRFSTEGFGAKKPVASNTKPDGSDDPAGRALNRRVEIVIRKAL